MTIDAGDPLLLFNAGVEQSSARGLVRYSELRQCGTCKGVAIVHGIRGHYSYSDGAMPCPADGCDGHLVDVANVIQRLVTPAELREQAQAAGEGEA